jgi:hypothetical protein
VPEGRGQRLQSSFHPRERDACHGERGRVRVRSRVAAVASSRVEDWRTGGGETRDEATRTASAGATDVPLVVVAIKGPRRCRRRRRAAETSKGR